MGPQLEFPTWLSHQPEVPVNMDSRLARCGEREGVSFALETHTWLAQRAQAVQMQGVNNLAELSAIHTHMGISECYPELTLSLSRC